MNIQLVYEELKSASDFELFRLQVAIGKLLEDPSKIAPLKGKIQIGMDTEYFCTERNKSIACTVLQIRRTRVAIKEKNTGKKWALPFYALNLDDIETPLQSNQQKGITKAELAIGDTVGFIDSRDNQEFFGQVIKLNPKRAVIIIDNTSWTVPYEMLFPVLTSGIDAEKQTLLIAERD
ncbi:hypothetical protein [Shewanella glacialipiscicola]|uniref:hypothetical protein n=1 Tax=Shewanella glacialipiscicola TaxID=614069 RepID=UPI003D7BE350